MCRLSGNLGTWTPWNAQSLSRPVQGLLYLCIMIVYFDAVWAVQLWERLENHSQIFIDICRRTSLKTTTFVRILIGPVCLLWIKRICIILRNGLSQKWLKIQNPIYSQYYSQSFRTNCLFNCVACCTRQGMIISLLNCLYGTCGILASIRINFQACLSLPAFLQPHPFSSGNFWHRPAISFVAFQRVFFRLGYSQTLSWQFFRVAFFPRVLSIVISLL